ncbi:MAG: acyl carrier protein [Chloroflexi bacterium]|nr:acyl carrier protein [Chloroflexota bacterium]
MASTEERVKSLISENLEVDGKPVEVADLSSSLTGLGVSSMDVVSFARVIQNEFGVSFTPENCTELQTISQLIEYLDAA